MKFDSHCKLISQHPINKIIITLVIRQLRDASQSFNNF